MYTSITITTFFNYCHYRTFQLFPLQSFIYFLLKFLSAILEIIIFDLICVRVLFLGILEGRVLEQRIQQIMATHAELLTRTRTEASRR
jgi:hypothetical protein